MNTYTLNDEGIPVREPDLIKWTRWMWMYNRISKRSEQNGICVSTVFLGLDLEFGKGEHPVLFETLITGGLKDGHQERYTNRVDALSGHTRNCILAGIGLPSESIQIKRVDLVQLMKTLGWKTIQERSNQQISERVHQIVDVEITNNMKDLNIQLLETIKQGVANKCLFEVID